MALPVRSVRAAHGIPTTYSGTRFRSRLEGRWAAFFDLIGWQWIYEPWDTADWIPDFLIQGVSPFLVEIGPCELMSDYHTKAAKPLAAYPPINVYCERIDHAMCGHGDDYIVSDAPERVTLILGALPLVNQPGGGTAGLLTSDGSSSWTAGAEWGRCSNCQMVVVTHHEGIFTHFPCGHYTGGDWGDSISDPELIQLWNRASTPTQWRGAR